MLQTHLAFVGIWLGCVLTEALFERALLGKGEPEAILVALHKRVDLFIEIPAFIIVLLTGLMMFQWETATPLFLIKVGIAAIAIIANIYCVWLVFRRADAQSSGDKVTFARLDHLQHQYGAIVLVGIVVALVMGISL